MGNHEHPCVVCGENTMTAFNYDCERRHNTEVIRAKIKSIKQYCKRQDDQPCDYHLRNIRELETLLATARLRHG